MPETSIEPDEPTDETPAVLEGISAYEKKVRQRKEAARAGLDEALAAITATISEHWGSGSGSRLSQIVWSLYHRTHPVGLGDILSNFDAEHGLAVAKLLDAKMAGVLDDAMIRRVLKESGELARYEAAERDTPQGGKVLYPPPPLSAAQLRRWADAAASKEAQEQADNERLARLGP